MNNHNNSESDSSSAPRSSLPMLSDAAFQTTLQNHHPALWALVQQAKRLHQTSYSANATHQQQQSSSFTSPPSAAFVAVAPGRVNLIGEHTDYNDGFVLPFAIDKYTVVYGTGSFVVLPKLNAKETETTPSPSSVTVHMVSSLSSSNDPVAIVERSWTYSSSSVVNGYAPAPPPPPSSSTTSKSSSKRCWSDYVLGTIAQYMAADVPSTNVHLQLHLAFTSNIPLGSGLSSSAALEVATATLTECFLHDYYNPNVNRKNMKITRALRCQKAENEWAHSPCGIMDQLVSSAAVEHALVLIDCQGVCDDNNITVVHMKDNQNTPVMLVTNSGVHHSIAGLEYGVRRAQCQHAVQALQHALPKDRNNITSLRQVTLDDLEAVQSVLGDTIPFVRARHVVSENIRTIQCKEALEAGDWHRVGVLMNASHQSLDQDYNVSCAEVNFLVAFCQNFPGGGVYGSRMTGGGFGGCIISLVRSDVVHDLQTQLAAAYNLKMAESSNPPLQCESFVTVPSFGAKVLAMDIA